MDAAEILFVTKGYTKATVMDILQACNIAKGTFYYYFQSKEEVMNAIVMRFILSGEASARHVVSDPKLNAHDKIFRIMMAQNQPDGRKHDLIEQLHSVHNVEMHQKSLVETVIRLSPILAEVVEQGIQEGVFHTPNPKESIEFLLVSSQFLLDRGIFQWEEEELQKRLKHSHILWNVCWEQNKEASPTSLVFIFRIKVSRERSIIHGTYCSKII